MKILNKNEALMLGNKILEDDYGYGDPMLLQSFKRNVKWFIESLYDEEYKIVRTNSTD